MSKRAASSNLNKDNWNEEETPEEMGVFQRASVNELKARSIKRAKRRAGIISGDGETVSVFKNFKAFASPNLSSSSSTPTFSFLSENGEKPKLTNPNPFPSFTFSNANSQTKDDSEAKSLSNKSSISNSAIPKFSFTSSAAVSACNEVKNVSNNEDPKVSSTNFCFGNTKPTSDKPTFNFDANKGLQEKTSEGPTFKFGIGSNEKLGKLSSEAVFKSGNSSESRTMKTSASPAYKFGIDSTNQINRDLSLQSNSSCLEGFKSPTVNGAKTKNLESTPTTNLFLANLKALNTGVVSWIKQHVEKNKYINLTPVFDDYRKYFEEIKKKCGMPTEKDKPNDISSPKESQQSLISQLKNNTCSDKHTFSFGLSNIKTTSTSKLDTSSVASNNASTLASTNSTSCKGQASEAKSLTFENNDSINSSSKVESQAVSEKDISKSTPTFSFGVNNKSSTTFSFGSSGTKPTFTFGSGDSSTKLTGFSFGVPKESQPSGFKFESSNTSSTGINLKPDSSKNTEKKENQEGEEEADEVPKVEVKEVKEEDAIFDKKVKLFYKKDDKYVDRGVGTLFLKPTGEKTQLLIRALTNLGNVLLNIILNESIPTQKVGKNNVLLVCVPNPPIGPNSSGPVSMLIKVKTEEDADELLKKLNEHKK